MKAKSNRLYFIDALRAWAILMMLQGHFVDGLLDMDFRDGTHLGFNTWTYFRGITAPVFFTVSGFIFTFLLIRVPEKGWGNPRVKKGIKRGLQLLFIGYLLRMNLFGLFSGEIYSSFYLVDVLHCIGLSILGIIGIYLFTVNGKTYMFPLALIGVTISLFAFEPMYKQWGYTLLPEAFANYFTKANGSVFTIFPWFGYASFGGFLSILFAKFKHSKYLYPTAISLCLGMGFLLIFQSSDFFWGLYGATGIHLFAEIYFNNYLFIRLGDVFIVLAVFMLLRNFLKNSTVLKIGQSTLSIYIIHFIVLYGSFTGLGLYRFFDHSLTPASVIPGALAFIIVCTYTSLQYERHKASVKFAALNTVRYVRHSVTPWYIFSNRLVKISLSRLLRLFGLVKY